MSNSSLLQRLVRPPVYQRWEWILMRVLLCWPIYTATAKNAARFDQASQPHPIGVAQFMDLTWLADPTPVSYTHLTLPTT